MRPQPLLAVVDVEASSSWYQILLGCRSDHGGKEYERLVDGDRLILQLHNLEIDHDHGTIGDPAAGPRQRGAAVVRDRGLRRGRRPAASSAPRSCSPCTATRPRASRAVRPTGRSGCATSTATASCWPAPTANRRCWATEAPPSSALGSHPPACGPPGGGAVRSPARGTLARPPTTPTRGATRSAWSSPTTGGELRQGGTATLFVDGQQVGQGRVEATVPMLFSADETVDLGSTPAHRWPTTTRPTRTSPAPSRGSSSRSGPPTRTTSSPPWSASGWP